MFLKFKPFLNIEFVCYEPTGFEEDQYIIVAMKNNTYELYEETGMHTKYHGKFDTLLQAKNEYKEWC